MWAGLVRVGACVCQAAQASLAAVVSELADALPQLAACRSAPVFLSGVRSRALAGRAAVRSSTSGSNVDDLVAQARSIIEAARTVRWVVVRLALAGVGLVAGSGLIWFWSQYGMVPVPGGRVWWASGTVVACCWV